MVVDSEGEPCGEVAVRINTSAAVITYRTCEPDEREWKPVEQRIPIEWTACHFGGGRPWFRCKATSNGQYCGRRVALYLLDSIFACRRCYGLGYASQLEGLGGGG